jgi:hypothetical protein
MMKEDPSSKQQGISTFLFFYLLLAQSITSKMKAPHIL